jgi:intracellular sulfur oxidation DsrE/DsrF family protein
MNGDDRTVSDELLNAFLDGQVDADERGSVLDRLRADRELAQRACELRHVKDLTQHAYQTQLPVPEKRRGPVARVAGHAGLLKALAAGLLLALGAILGWTAHRSVQPPQVAAIAGFRLQAPTASSPAAADVQHIILHLSSGNPHKVDVALDETEDLIKSYKNAGRKLQVEFVANAGGLDLLRAGVSPEAARVRRLMKEYKNLTFLACRKTIEHLQERGVQVKLLPHTHVAPSALQQIIERLKEGWVYIKV